MQQIQNNKDFLNSIVEEDDLHGVLHDPKLCYLEGSPSQTPSPTPSITSLRSDSAAMQQKGLIIKQNGQYYLTSAEGHEKRMMLSRAKSEDNFRRGFYVNNELIRQRSISSRSESNLVPRCGIRRDLHRQHSCGDFESTYQLVHLGRKQVQWAKDLVFVHTYQVPRATGWTVLRTKLRRAIEAIKDDIEF